MSAVLGIIAFILTIFAALGHIELWIPVIVLCAALIIPLIPLRRAE